MIYYRRAMSRYYFGPSIAVIRLSVDWPVVCSTTIAWSMESRANSELRSRSDLHPKIIRSELTSVCPMMPERHWVIWQTPLLSWLPISFYRLESAQQQWQWLACPLLAIVLSRFTPCSSTTTTFHRSLFAFGSVSFQQTWPNHDHWVFW